MTVKCFTKSLMAIFIAIVMVFSRAHASDLHYSVGAQDFKGHIEKPSGKPLGKVFIIHDWNGLNQYEIMRAEKLAALGYEAVALDLFGVGAILEGFEDYKREAGALYANRQEFQARILAAVTVVWRRQRVKTTPKPKPPFYCFTDQLTQFLE